jgi:aspartate racemase
MYPSRCSGWGPIVASSMRSGKGRHDRSIMPAATGTVASLGHGAPPVKTIGLLGGTSWPSTIEYYRLLNELAQETLGGFHSASLLLRSIDYQEIRSRYYERWEEIPALLAQEIRAFVALGPDCLVICNNTLHKAFDAIEAELSLAIPVFHIVRVTGRYAQSRNLRRVLLLGTQFTMEDGYYHRGLERFGLRVETPDAADRAAIQRVQSQLARGVMKEQFRTFLAGVVGKHAATVDAVVLACTELPLALTQKDCSLPVINPTEQQCREAFEFATGKGVA